MTNQPVKVHLQATINSRSDTMKKMNMSVLIFVGMFLLIPALSGQSDALVWTDRGCDSTYTVGDSITIYFAPYKGVEYELWAYDALMNTQLLVSGVGEGNTYSIEEIITPPVGPLTFVLKMPCEGECELCDLCDYDQCSVIVEGEDPCKDHCTNQKQDCGEYGVDCGGGCPLTDSDSDGVEDCIDLCPNSRCDKVDADGCETDVDADGVIDCEDDCPHKKGDASNRGCPTTNVFVIVSIIGVIAVGGGLALWKMKKKPH